MFTAMDMNRGYIDLMNMPIKMFYDFIQWKFELEKEKQKKIEEITNNK